MKDIMPWKEGAGWSRDELRWTDKDTALVEKILEQKNVESPSGYRNLLRRHESL